MTGYEINRLFVKKVGSLITPSVIYRNLKVTEKKCWARSTLNKGRKIYSLTEEGRAIVDNMNSLTQEIHGCIKALLGS
jgi:DNA-binding PadR family transcriptional regulator